MNNRLVFAIGAIIAFSAFVVGYYLWQSFIERQYEERAQSIRRTIATDLYFDTASLDEYAAALEQLADPQVHAQHQIRLGAAYNLADKYERGVPLIKGVIADESVSADTRALGVAYLFLAYAKDRDQNVGKLVFDDSGIYNEALGGGDFTRTADLEAAYHRLFQIADEWQPVSLIKYLLALKSANDLLDTENLSEKREAEDIQAITVYIRSGDSLSAQERARTGYNGSLFQASGSFGWNFRFYNLTSLARFDVSKQSEVEESYRRITQAVAANQPHGGLLAIENYARFYYAAYLADVFGSARAADIVSSMAPTLATDGLQGRANENGIWPFYEAELTRPEPERNHNRRFILSIAALNPGFDAFLLSRGWKE